MTQQMQMTVHRALALIKKTKQDLQDTISKETFVSCVKGSSHLPVDSSFKSFQELKSHLQSNNDKVTSAFNLIAVLKEAVMKSNLNTYVDFLGVPTSIAKILVYKESLELKQEFLEAIQMQVYKAQQQINANETSKITPQLEQINLSGNSAAEKEVLQQNINNIYSMEMVTGNSNKTPSQLVTEIKDQITYLTSEINTVLSETNVTTIIEIDI